MDNVLTLRDKHVFDGILVLLLTRCTEALEENCICPSLVLPAQTKGTPQLDEVRP
jgi:hypothetical protein